MCVLNSSCSAKFHRTTFELTLSLSNRVLSPPLKHSAPYSATHPTTAKKQKMNESASSRCSRCGSAGHLPRPARAQQPQRANPWYPWESHCSREARTSSLNLPLNARFASPSPSPAHASYPEHVRTTMAAADVHPPHMALRTAWTDDPRRVATPHHV